MTRNRTHWRYARQLVILVEDEVGDLINELATTNDLHKSEVLRSLLYAGIRKAGYADRLPPNKRTPTITADNN